MGSRHMLHIFRADQSQDKQFDIGLRIDILLATCLNAARNSSVHLFFEDGTVSFLGFAHGTRNRTGPVDSA